MSTTHHFLSQVGNALAAVTEARRILKDAEPFDTRNYRTYLNLIDAEVILDRMLNSAPPVSASVAQEPALCGPA
jgi:hypothetical protein